MKITLKAARINAGLTQVEAAQAIEVARTTIQHWESGKTFPKPEYISRLTQLYHIPYDYITFLPERNMKNRAR